MNRSTGPVRGRRVRPALDAVAARPPARRRAGARRPTYDPGVDTDRVHVVAEGPAWHERAVAVAASLGARGPVAADDVPPGDLALVVGPDGLGLRLGDGPRVAAAAEALRRPRRQAPDPLWRAVLAGAEAVVDATAGLGADGFHLAARGARVTLIERSPLLAALLADALSRARAGELGPDAAAAADRVELVAADARDALAGGGLPSERRGVVYLDPMFAARDGSALPPKGMALLRAVLGPDDEDGAELLAVARRAATRRVVVKRHLRAGPLGGVPPSGSLRGRTVRFDVYAPL